MQVSKWKFTFSTGKMIEK